MKTLEFADGDQMPIIVLVTWKSPAGEISEVVSDALSLGYRHIDCGAIYAHEVGVG